jgi:hypothetical protein
MVEISNLVYTWKETEQEVKQEPTKPEETQQESSFLASI